MHPAVPGQLGVKAGGHQIPLADGHDPTVGRSAHDPAEHLDRLAGLLDPRRADEHGVHRAAVDAAQRQVGLEAVDLPAEGVAAHGDVQPADRLLVRRAVEQPVGEQDHPGAGAVDRQAIGDRLAQRVEQAEPVGELGDRGRLATGQHQAVDGLELLGTADRARLGAPRPQRREVLADVALQREHPDCDVPRPPSPHHPRVAYRSDSGSVLTLMPTIGSPRPRETLAITAGSSKKVVACTIAAARCAGSPDLKMPEPTKTPSAPSCIIIAASAGVAMPPAVKRTTGSFPSRATSATTSYGARSSLAAAYSSVSSRVPSRLMPDRIARMCRVASTTLPVPASPLERIIAAPSEMRRSASPRSVAPQTNGTVNALFAMWCASSAGVSTSDSSM